MNTNKKAMTMSLLELMFAVIVLGIACLGLSAAFMDSVTLGDITSEEVVAGNAIQEQMAEIVSFYKDPDSYTYGGETYHGFDAVVGYFSDGNNNTFAVEGLGEVTVGTNVGSIILHLNEGSIPSEFGSNLDLDGNGSTSDNLASAAKWDDVNLLPVEVKVDWLNKSGNTLTASRYLLLVRSE